MLRNKMRWNGECFGSTHICRYIFSSDRGRILSFQDHGTETYDTPLSSQDNCEGPPYHDPLCSFMRPQDPREWLHRLTLTLRPP